MISCHVPDQPASYPVNT